MSSRRKKRAVSLVETIVCLGLVAVLLSCLSFWYRSVSQQKAAFNLLKGPLLEERYAHQRLQRILPTAELPFFTVESDKSLVFIFDRGPFVHPKLSGKVLGRLFFDEAGQRLCLGVWPYPQGDEPRYSPSQTTVLLDGVKDCRFAFYSPPDLFKKPVDPEYVGKPCPHDGWQSEWLRSYATLPALVKVTVTRDKTARGAKSHTIDYELDLPIGILYPEETL